MNLTKEEKADRYDALQYAIRWTIEQYRKRIRELENDGRNGQKPVLAAFIGGEISALKQAIEDMEKWV